MKIISVVALLSLIVGCGKQYKSRVVLTPAATDRRLATGKSDVVEGVVKSGDANAVFVEVDGQLEAIPRADVVSVDQKEAKSDVTLGALAAIVGGIVLAGGIVVWNRGESVKSSTGAVLAMGLGIGLTGIGLRALFSGLGGQHQTDNALRGAQLSRRWHVAPAIVVERDGLAPGFGLSRRF
ncbi:MAG: hypothetical protein AB7T06_03400 [Kofleriaceae bacterium]